MMIAVMYISTIFGCAAAATPDVIATGVLGSRRQARMYDGFLFHRKD